MIFVYAAVVAGILLWLAMGVGLGVMAWDMFRDGDWSISAVVGLLAVLVLVAPLAIYYGDPADPHAMTLCLRGHQEWRTTQGTMMVGKVIVPTRSTRKVWMCEQWEAR